MRQIYHSTCPRCGFRESAEGVGLAEARLIAGTHVCVDGVQTPSGEPVLDLVPGPGERTKLPEEKGGGQ